MDAERKPSPTEMGERSPAVLEETWVGGLVKWLRCLASLHFSKGKIFK